ncbi:MAG: iron-sulfur cluster assembly scaffold protein [Candidatus Magasanikbacteria bacterium]
MNNRDTIYREKLLHLYKNPNNYGELEDCNIKESGHNPYCGDQIEIFIKLEEGFISGIRWKGEGCVISQVAASLLTEELKRTNINKLEKIKEDRMLSMLEIPISFARKQCALLALKTIKKIRCSR